MIGRTIGAYRIDAKLGQGGMGAVYRGLDLMLERPVAIKALRADIAASSQHVERFRQEAKTLARLLHPHIATLYALLREGDDLYMVMEFVEGETFEAVLHRERRIPVEHALRLFDQALRGIDHAHQRGIIHRDVKPANFMVMPSGTVKVMDFGIARLLGTTRMTQTRHAIGTAEYMAPEQVRAREVDARTDVYALGILLYEMVTGRVPFEAESSFETMQAHLQAEPRSPRVLTSDLPTSVEAAILTALAKEPDDRHASVAAFRAALADVTPTGPPIPLPVPLVEKVPAPEPTPPQAAPTKRKKRKGPAPETIIAPARGAVGTVDASEAPPKVTDELALDEVPTESDADADELANTLAATKAAPTEENSGDASSTPPLSAGEEHDALSEPEPASSTDDDPPTVPSPATRIAAPATVVADAAISDPNKTAPATVLAPAAVAPTVVAPSPAPETMMAPAVDRAVTPSSVASSLITLPRAVIAGVLGTLVVAAGLWMLRPSTPDVPEEPETPEQTDMPEPGSRAGGGSSGLASAGTQTGEFAVPGPPPEINPAAPQEPETGSQTVQEPRPAERTPDRRAEDPPARTTPSDTRQPKPRQPEPRQPEPRQPERQPEPAAPQTGTARVLVRPFGDVYIDGRRLARGTNAPVTADLAPGTYTVRATHPVFGELTERVRVRAGETANVRLQFATPVEVTVTSSPSNAEILLDGRATGRYTPATISVPPGTHRIALERNGVTTPSRSLTITAGQSPARIQFSLTQAP